MGRWEPDARGRLERAALELYGERGFEQTTVAEIARRAGLTERTFFRHFADKREVLFGGTARLRDLLAEAAEKAPASASPIEAVGAGLQAGAGMLGEHHERARRRHAIIADHAELRERELIKMAALADALAGALRRRGVPDLTASLAAEAGIAAFRVAFERWVADPGRPDLARLVRQALDELKAVTADG